MKDVADMEYFSDSEKLVSILMDKTQNTNPLFFRVLVAYYFAKVASMMRTNILTHDRGSIPVSVYAINLGVSGSGKGHSTNIIEEQVINKFKENFLDITFPSMAEVNLAKLAVKRAHKYNEDPDDMLEKVRKEFERLGQLAFSFDSGTTAAVKQMRHKLLMADAGSINLQIDECYTGDVEVLTNKGFIRFDTLTEQEIQVAQFDTTTKEISFVIPSRFINKHYSGNVYDLVTPTGFDMSVTEEHDVLVVNKKGNYSKVKPYQLNTGHFIPLTGKAAYNSTRSLTDEERLSIAIQADGTLRKSGGIELGFKKSRKIKAMIDLLTKLGIEFSSWETTEGYTHFYIRKDQLTSVTVTKDLTDLVPNITQVSSNFCKEFIDEVVKWDGSINKKLPNILRYTNTHLASVELVHCLAILAGYNCKMYTNTKEGYAPCFYVSINTSGISQASLAYLNKEHGNSSPIRTIRKYEGNVYCVTVPTGNIVLRRNGKSFIGGNCGSNLLSNVEVLTAFLELFDQGKIKQKLTKNTNENVRSEEIDGKTPTNMLLFGTPSKLLNGGKVEEEFHSMLETGYARRCLFGYAKNHEKKIDLTPEQIYDMLTSKQSEQFLEDLSKRLGQLADMVNFGTTLTMSKDVSLLLISYKLRCEKLSEEFMEHEEVHKAEMSHRYYKAIKLAGAYAFIAGSDEITEDLLYAAIKLVEESGEAFKGILTRERNYVKLAKYIANIGKELTQADLVEDLPFYKGSDAQKKDMMALAIAYGYKNNIVIKRMFSEGIEFISGESMKETDLNKMSISYSTDITYNYTADSAPFDMLHKVVTASGYHYCAHGFKDGHRNAVNALQGFNLVILDVDDGTKLNTAQMLLKGYKALFATTKSHTDQKNRFRIILPLSHTVKLNPENYKLFMQNIFDWMPFSVDTATCDIARKWESFNGSYTYQDGEMLDALLFIPQTKKAEDNSKKILDSSSLSNLERWFYLNIQSGNRSNQLIKYAYVLVDSGYTFDQVKNAIFSFNEKLKDGLSEEEINNTILVSTMKAISKRDN